MTRFQASLILILLWMIAVGVWSMVALHTVGELRGHATKVYRPGNVYRMQL